MSEPGPPADPRRPPNDGGAPSPNPYGEPTPYPGAVPGQQPGQPPPNPYQPTAPSGGGFAGAIQPPAPYPFGPGTYELVPRPIASAGYASWLARVGAVFIDGLANAVAAAPFYAGYISLLGSHLTTTENADGSSTVHVTGSIGLPVTLMVVGMITSLAFFIWNICLRQGRTGATVGKSILAIRLVNQSEGRPIGPLLAFVRHLCHIVDGLFCGLGYLWPLWDAKNQTFADKIMSTVVINAVEDPPRPL